MWDPGPHPSVMPRTLAGHMPTFLGLSRLDHLTSSLQPLQTHVNCCVPSATQCQLHHCEPVTHGDFSVK